MSGAAGPHSVLHRACGKAHALDPWRHLKTVTVENIGHAPMLDEPDALLEFLAKVE